MMLRGKQHRPMVLEGMRELDDDQLALLEDQMERQEDHMKDRMSAASTRAAILIGASAVLSGTELVTASGLPWISTLSLVLYLLAAIFGLLATRSRLMLEPHLEVMVPRYYGYSTITLRRSLMLSRIDAHAVARSQVNQRHHLLVIGFALLLAAWVASASSTTYALLTPQEESPTRIEIIEGR